MPRSSSTRWVVALVALASCQTAYGPIRGDLIDTGPDNTGLWIELLVITREHGVLSDMASRGGTILGRASVVAFPDGPPFTDILVDSWSAEVGPAAASFSFPEAGIDVDVALMSYQAVLAEPFEGIVDSWIQSGPATYQVDMTARVVSAQLGLDITMTTSGLMEDSFLGEIAMSSGNLYLGRTPPPDVALTSNPGDLPDGVAVVGVAVSMDAGNTSYHGTARPVLVGDSNLDGDSDLSDFGFGSACVADMADLRCMLFDVDGDGALTLIDFAAFQRAFTGDASGS